jgi:hypothetical protein
MPTSRTARHRCNRFAGFFIVSIPVRSVPELGTMATLPQPPNHSAFIVPVSSREVAFALRLPAQLAALVGPQGAGDAGRGIEKQHS